MTLTGKNQSTRRKNSPTATLSTKDFMMTSLGSYPGLSSDRL